MTRRMMTDDEARRLMASRRSERRTSMTDPTVADLAETWRCERCGATFPSLIACIAHVEIKHPRGETLRVRSRKGTRG